MARYFVWSYSEGKSDGLPPRQIEAKSATDAARMVCGEGLVTRGHLGELRAQVSPVSDPEVTLTLFKPSAS